MEIEDINDEIRDEQHLRELFKEDEINIPEKVLVALGNLTNGALNYYKATKTIKVKYNTILDHIINLHQENERLNKEKSILEKSLKLIWKKDIKIDYEELDKANKDIEEFLKEGK